MYILFGSLVKFHNLHNSLWNTIPTQLSLVLYSFCACLPYLLIMELTVSFFFHITCTNNSAVYYRFLLSYNWPLWHCFVSLLKKIKFPFRSHEQVFSCKICRLKYSYSCFIFFLNKPRKARFIPTFCKRINRTSTAVEIWWQLLKKGTNDLYLQQNLYTTTTINRVLHQME